MVYKLVLGGFEGGIDLITTGGVCIRSSSRLELDDDDTEEGVVEGKPPHKAKLFLLKAGEYLGISEEESDDFQTSIVAAVILSR